MTVKVYRSLYVLLFLCLTLPSLAQTLDNLGDQDPVQVSGSVNATAISYSASGIEQRRDPFNWFTTGNINLSLYGWSVPFSFSFSDQNESTQLEVI